MCIIHDLGEAFTGDIPSFEKSPADEDREETLLHRWVASLPASCAREMEELYEEKMCIRDRKKIERCCQGYIAGRGRKEGFLP